MYSPTQHFLYSVATGVIQYVLRLIKLACFEQHT